MHQTIAKRTAVLLAVLLLALSLAACKNEKEEPAAAPNPAVGSYAGLYGKWVGDDEPDADEVFSMDLNADGTGVFHRDDYDFRLTWTLDGEKISITEKFLGASNEYTGTLVDGRLDIFTGGDPDDPLSYEYVLQKQ